MGAEDKEFTKKSRSLSRILRHDPGSVGITLDGNGWAKTGDICRALKLKASELGRIVTENDKQRFEFSDCGTKIRARQGHSIDVDTELENVTDLVRDAELYHGTKRQAVGSIFREGLKKMKRKHVHLTMSIEAARKRAGSGGVVLAIQPKGISVFKSRNDVYLMDFVPPQSLYVKEEL